MQLIQEGIKLLLILLFPMLLTLCMQEYYYGKCIIEPNNLFLSDNREQ